MHRYIDRQIDRYRQTDTHTHRHTHRHTHTHADRQTDRHTCIHPSIHQDHLKENIDYRKTNLRWCSHLYHQALREDFLQELPSCHSLDLSRLTLTLPLLPYKL